jgi:hypothetical protein
VNYTKEPWVVSYGYADNGAGFVSIVSSSSGESIVGEYGLTEEDARRIVACVNACADMPTDWLERTVHIFADYDALRDELLSALKEHETFYQKGMLNSPSGEINRLSVLRKSLIAKCEAQS